jgi:hypothetical protein
MTAAAERHPTGLWRPFHDPNGLCAADLWLGEARYEGDQLALAVRVRLLVDGPELVAGGAVGEAEAFSCGFQRRLTKKAVCEPRLRGGEAEDAHEIGGDYSGPRCQVDEDDEPSASAKPSSTAPERGDG